MAFTYTIGNLKTDLTGIIHGANLDKIQGILPLINRSASEVLLEVDPQETKRYAQIENAIYDQVFDYSVPTDLKGNKIIDIRPQINRDPSDNFTQTYSEQFDIYKENNSFQIKFDTGVKTVRISKDLRTGIVLNTMDSITNNGTWAVGNDAENLTVDTLNFIAGSASLKFDLDGLTTDGFIQNSTMTAQDLSTHEDESSLFLFLFLPDASAFTSVDLRWGSDTTNFWNRTVTVPQNGTFLNGWNLVRFDWNGATETGAPNAAAIDTLRVTVNYDGVADTDYRVDSIMSKLGSIFTMVYYSKFIFQNSSGTFIENAASDSDIINLDTEARDLLLYKVAENTAQQLQGEDSGFDSQFFARKYNTLLTRYKSIYKSEVEKPRQPYYRMPNQGKRFLKILP